MKVDQQNDLHRGHRASLLLGFNYFLVDILISQFWNDFILQMLEKIDE